MTHIANVTTIDDAAGISKLVDLASRPVWTHHPFSSTSRALISLATATLPFSPSWSTNLYPRNKSCKNGTTLKDILESPTTPKVFFDVRNDSDALYSHYKIALQGIQDVQLMENASRRLAVTKKYVNGLARCVRSDAPLDARERKAWEQAKATGERLFKPEIGGSYAVFDQRPVSPAIESYCAADVRCLPALRQLYWSKLSTEMRRKVGDEAERRVRESQMPGYQPKGPNRTLAPRWGEEEADLESLFTQYLNLNTGRTRRSSRRG